MSEGATSLARSERRTHTRSPAHGPGSPPGKETSVLFRTMLKKAADQLTPEDVQSLVYIHSVVGKGGREEKERLTALEVFRQLEVRGTFSADSLEPLEELLGDISRHDVANSVVREFRVQMKSVRRCDSDPLLSHRNKLVHPKRDHVSMDTPDSQPSSAALPDRQRTTSLRANMCLLPPMSLPASMSTEEKLGLLDSLIVDPDLQAHLHSDLRASHLRGAASSDDPLQTRALLSSIGSPDNGQMRRQQSGDSRGSSSSGFFSSPDTSLSTLTFDPLTRLPETGETSQTPRPKSTLERQISSRSDDFIDVTSPLATEHRASTGDSVEPLPPLRCQPCSSWYTILPQNRGRMDWNIDRVELGKRVVEHCNVAYVKGNFSLNADGMKFRFRKPVSLVFKVYPYGIGKDQNQSLSLEVLVECRSADLKSLGLLNLVITASMGNRKEFLTSKQLKKPLKTFTIHDFIPHEVITHSHSKWLELSAEAHVSFDMGPQL